MPHNYLDIGHFLLPLKRMYVAIYLHCNRTVAVENERAGDGFGLTIGSTSRYGRKPTSARDFISGFIQHQIAEIKRDEAIKTWRNFTQASSEIASKVVGTIHNVRSFLGAKAGKREFAYRCLASQPVWAGKITITFDADVGGLRHIEIGASHEPVHPKTVIVGGCAACFYLVECGVAGHTAAVQVGINDGCCVNGGDCKACGSVGYGIFDDFGSLTAGDEFDDFFGIFAAGSECGQCHEKQDREKGQQIFLNAFHNEWLVKDDDLWIWLFVDLVPQQQGIFMLTML